MYCQKSKRPIPLTSDLILLFLSELDSSVEGAKLRFCRT